MVETGVQSICLKPKGKSASSDVILISRSMGKRLTVGLAVKNYCGTSFTNNHLEKECDLFNRMFTTSKSVQSATKEGYAILIVCATQYGQNLCQFNGKHAVVLKPPKEFSYIDEIILINLTESTTRAEFFGLEAGDPLSTALEEVISKYEIELTKSYT